MGSLTADMVTTLVAACSVIVCNRHACRLDPGARHSRLWLGGCASPCSSERRTPAGGASQLVPAPERGERSVSRSCTTPSTRVRATRKLNSPPDRAVDVRSPDSPPPPALHVVPAEELQAAVAERQRGQRFPVCLTFDDDLSQHVDCAMPILRDTGVPATFFLCGRAWLAPRARGGSDCSGPWSGATLPRAWPTCCRRPPTYRARGHRHSSPRAGGGSAGTRSAPGASPNACSSGRARPH